MRIPNLPEAEKIFQASAELTPGAWVKHSINVATAAKLIAERCPDLNSEVSYVVGLLHDIGRRVGTTQMRHVLDGYHYLTELGYEDAARICMTHTFSYKYIQAIYGSWDCSKDELKFIEDYLATMEYNDYDRLIQLCDSLVLPTGFSLLEKRFVETALKFGTNEYTVLKWKSVFDIKTYFEQKINVSVYNLLPGVVNNTFGIATD